MTPLPLSRFSFCLDNNLKFVNLKTISRIFSISVWFEFGIKFNAAAQKFNTPCSHNILVFTGTVSMRVSERSVIAVMSVMLLASSLVLLLSARADANWIVQVVDEKATLSGGLSLAVDSRGNPHIVYIATESGNYYTGGHITARVNPQYLTYASWNGSGWDKQTAEYFYIPDLRPSTLGSVGGFVLDSNDHPHIVYTVAVQNDSESSVGYVKRSILKYASWTGTEWNIQTVDNGTGGSIALDSAATRMSLTLEETASSSTPVGTGWLGRWKRWTQQALHIKAKA